MAMTLLGDALKKRLGSDLSLKRQVETGNLLLVASEVLGQFVGPENTKYIKPLFVKNRTLTITCSNSALSQEIHLNQAKIVESINQKIGENSLDRIRYLL
ncbi:MAG: hypothetical protein QG669_243 [Patescibacteria group bacterium]|jgi:hypothetical protein|nr:hypothetical protein [Patescibacteria group bacterium]